jgi:hypothetical protein
MKVKLLTLILVTLHILVIGCSSPPIASKLSTNARPKRTPIPPADLISDVAWLSFRYDEMLKTIAGYSKQMGIGELRKAKIPDSDTEVRIWHGFGLATPICLVLKIQDGNSVAYRMAVEIVNDKGVMDKNGEFVYVKADMQSPRSGWNEVISYLKSQGVLPSIKLSLNNTVETRGTDEEFIVIEARTGLQYSMVFYPDSTMSQDGQSAFNICRRIENEFGVRVGC